MDELLPCPFCGSAAYAVYGTSYSSGWVVICDKGDCGAAGPMLGFRMGSEAIKAWNRRAPVKTETTEDARTRETTT